MARSRRNLPVIEIPEEHEEKDDGWKRAYTHARQAGNGEKASVIFAESHNQADEFNQEDGDGTTP